jgi:hypothetical protein
LRSRGFAADPSESLCLLAQTSSGQAKKEGALVCSKGANMGLAQQSSAGLLPLKKGDYPIALSSQMHLLACFAGLPTQGSISLVSLSPDGSLRTPFACHPPEWG